MDRITVDYWRNVPSGEFVEDGFGKTKRAPLGGGTYTLYELVDEANIHRGWHWEKEQAETEQIETCPYCDFENEYPDWNPDVSGFIAVCKNCGKKIFLCDACMHHEDNQTMRCDQKSDEAGRCCFRGRIDN